MLAPGSGADDGIEDSLEDIPEIIEVGADSAEPLGDG